MVNNRLYGLPYGMGPKPEVVADIDYAEAERLLLAYRTAFPAFAIDTNTAMPDIHKRRAVQEFGVAYDEVTPDQRRAAKALNFGDLYGMPKGTKLSRYSYTGRHENLLRQSRVGDALMAIHYRAAELAGVHVFHDEFIFDSTEHLAKYSKIVDTLLAEAKAKAGGGATKP